MNINTFNPKEVGVAEAEASFAIQMNHIRRIGCTHLSPFEGGIGGVKIIPPGIDMDYDLLDIEKKVGVCIGTKANCPFEWNPNDIEKEKRRQQWIVVAQNTANKRLSELIAEFQRERSRIIRQRLKIIVDYIRNSQELSWLVDEANQIVAKCPAIYGHHGRDAEYRILKALGRGVASRQGLRH